MDISRIIDLIQTLRENHPGDDSGTIDERIKDATDTLAQLGAVLAEVMVVYEEDKNHGYDYKCIFCDKRGRHYTEKFRHAENCLGVKLTER